MDNIKQEITHIDPLESLRECSERIQQAEELCGLIDPSTKMLDDEAHLYVFEDQTREQALAALHRAKRPIRAEVRMGFYSFVGQTKTQVTDLLTKAEMQEKKRDFDRYTISDLEVDATKKLLLKTEQHITEALHPIPHPPTKTYKKAKKSKAAVAMVKVLAMVKELEDRVASLEEQLNKKG